MANTTFQTDKNTASASNQLAEYIRGGETEQVEFKVKLIDSKLLARLIGGFANAKGGVILVGIREPDIVVGCDVASVRKQYEAALRDLTPTPTTTFSQIVHDGKTVVMISVTKSDIIVLTSEGAFQRVGEATRPMQARKIEQALRGDGQRPDMHLKMLTEALSDLTTKLEQAEKRSAEARRWPSKLTDQIVGAVVALAVSNLDKLPVLLHHLLK